MSGNTFDAGSIESRLVLDRSDFLDGLREAKAEGENFARQKYTAKLDVDHTSATRSLDTLKAELAGLRDVSLNVTVSGTNAQIRAISQSASALDGRDIRMSVDVAGLSDTLARMRTLRQQVNALDGRTIRVQADVDTADALTQIAALRAALAGLNNTTARVNATTGRTASALSKLKPGFADLVALGMAAGPALYPIAGYLTNIAAGSLALGVSVGAGVGLFAAAMIGAAKNVTALDKQAATAKKTLDTQKATLDKLTPGTKAYGTQLEKVEQAQQKLNSITAQYSPTQKAFSNGLDGMKASWQNFVDSTSTVTLPIATKFIDTATNALPKLEPVVKAMAPEFKAIADDVARWATNGGLDRFLDTVIKTGVPAFHNLRLGAKSVLDVLGKGYRAFLPEAMHLSEVIKQGGDRLKGWADSGGFGRFLTTVKQNAPQVKQFFSDLFAALGHISDSLGPLGGLSLQFVDGILKLINALPPSLIQAIYLGFIAWRTGMLLYAAATVIATIATATFETVASPFFLLMAGAALTIIGVVAAIVALGVGIYMLVKHWSTVQSALVTAWHATWNAIKVAALAVWNTVLKPAFDGIMTGLRTIGKWAMWLWTNAIKPAFDFISVGARLLVVIIGTVLITPVYLLIKGLGALFGWLWKVAIKPAFDGIAGGAKWLYAVAIKPQIDLIVAAVKGAGAVAKWLWSHAFKPAIDGIAGGAKWLYTNGIKPSFDHVVGAAKDVGKWARWLWSNAIKPAFDGIVGGAKWLYRNGIKPQFDLVVGAVKTVGSWGKWLWDKALKPAWNTITKGTGALKKGMIDAFDSMKSGIGKVWDKIKGVVAAPINFVIGTVYNGGVVKVWNKIADAVGLKSKELGTVGKIKFRHGGPVTGGAHGVDSVPALMMPGEHVWTTDEVKNAGGHHAVARMRAAFASAGRARVGPGRLSPTSGGGAYRFDSGGGILGALGGAWDATGGKVVHGVAEAGKWGLGKLEDLARGAIGAVVNPILNAIIKTATGGVKAAIPGSPPWESLVAGAATAPVKWIKDFVSKDDKKYSAIGGKIPSGQHKAIIDAALKAAGVPPPGTKEQWETGMNTLITRESGWNASAINNWDSNAKAGHPSQGLTQTIPGTFNAYVPKSLKSLGILNPIANVAASIRYIVSRYGNITRVQQANANKPPQGYAGGGVMKPGLNIVGEKGAELVASSGTDRVFTHADTRRLLRNSGSGDTRPVIVNFPDTITIKTENGSFEATVDDIARGTINDVVNEAAGSR